MGSASNAALSVTAKAAASAPESAAVCAATTASAAALAAAAAFWWEGSGQWAAKPERAHASRKPAYLLLLLQCPPVPCLRKRRNNDNRALRTEAAGEGSQWRGASSVRSRSREGRSPLPSTHTDDAAETRTDLSGDSDCRVVGETLSAGKAARRRQRARPSRCVSGSNEPPGTLLVSPTPA